MGGFLLWVVVLKGIDSDCGVYYIDMVLLVNPFICGSLIMSDSDCSNCDLDCTFRDDSYNCYVLVARDMQKVMGIAEIERLQDVYNMLSGLYDACSRYDSEISMAMRGIEDILALSLAEIPKEFV